MPTRTQAREQNRAVQDHQRRRAELVCSEPFLDRHVRPHLGPGTPATGGTWTTKVIQLDGSGAATVQVELDGGPAVFAKLFPFDDGPEVAAKLAALREAGLGAGSRYQSVEPLAWYDEEKVLLCRGAPGRALSELVGAADREALADGVAEAGRWLGRLHRAPLRVGTPRSLLVTGELVSLASRLAKVAAQRPDYVDEAVGLLEALGDLTRDTVDGVVAQCHGQYRPLHVFVAPETVTVIDLDRSVPADPARDVAEFLHRLRVLVSDSAQDAATADALCDAFLTAYSESVGGTGTLPNLRFHLARYALHSLHRKLKSGSARTASDDDAVYRFYRGEFDLMLAVRGLAEGRWLP